MARRIELNELAPRYDLIIVGGGITGAGILREAVRSGVKTLLVEQQDFASGTSSASSKLVHGGLRYLKNSQWRLTLESVRERQRLLDEAPGLIDPQPFLMPLFRGSKPGRYIMQIGLLIYDLMAGKRRSRWIGRDELLSLEPQVRQHELKGAVYYEDARTDDARMVLRLILESMNAGAMALNYVEAKALHDGARVTGVLLHDHASGQERIVDCAMVINATGAWAGNLPGAPGGAPPLRPLRGSHLVFSPERLPVTAAVSWLHPRDHRPIFAYPWEGAVVYGTTDLDHAHDAGLARISGDEIAYLLEGLAHQFPGLKLTLADALSTYSGVRPVVAGGKDDPSAESRESAIWCSPGLVGVTGGKLTTFRVTARDALREAANQVPALMPATAGRMFDVTEGENHRRLRGRLGAAAQQLLNESRSDDFDAAGGSMYTWAELRWALRHELVVHLDDLLLRRTRIGLVTTGGGVDLLPRVLDLCRAELGWDEARCSDEEARYYEIWLRRHAPVAA